MYRIFLVEDDTTMANAMAKQIRSWGNDVRCATHFEDILPEFLEYDPHLVILDIMLPFFNGHYWCSEIRKISSVPVVFLSSVSDNMNIVMAMNMGGDDFIAKPVDLEVMTAKISALLRRTYNMNSQTAALSYRGMVLNLNDSTVLYENQKLDLTKNEFRILQTLMQNAGKIVSRDTLMLKPWQMDEYVEENTLTVNVNRLRKKLAAIGLTDRIATKVGEGYILT